MTVIADLEVIEATLRQKALDITVQADAIAQSIMDLRAIDDVIDAAADAIETET